MALCDSDKGSGLSGSQGFMLSALIKRFCFFPSCVSPLSFYTKIKQEEVETLPPKRKADPFHSVNYQLLKPYSAHTTVAKS